MEPRSHAVVVDPAALERLRGLGGNKLILRMIELFSSHTVPKIKAARASYDAGAIEDVGRTAHAIKSSAGNLGIQQVYHLAGEIEQLASEGESKRIAPLLTELETALELAIAHLKEEKEGLER